MQNPSPLPTPPAPTALPIQPATVILGINHLLYDTATFSAPPVELFDPHRLAAGNLLRGTAAGRGQVWFFADQGQTMVLRHFRRGGLIEKLLVDRYWGRTPANSRAWREWHLLHRLYQQGLPVPRPLAARVVCGRLFYRADLITAAIPGAASLARHLSRQPLAGEWWRKLGAVIGEFHRQGIWHPDLNAHNILFDDQERPFLIDFDQSGFRPELGAGQNLARLQRSLTKLKGAETVFYFDQPAWSALLAGYRQIIPLPGSQKQGGQNESSRES